MIFEELLNPACDNVITVDNMDMENRIMSGRKRMRLHQLSWEEKIQRKKLRNRIAAQTSRDRKKARMDHLEEAVKELQMQNTDLTCHIQELQKQNESLLLANEELKKALSSGTYTCSCQSKTNNIKDKNETNRSNADSDQSCVRADHFLEVPAESSNNPPQKGRKDLTQNSMFMTSWTLWKVLLYLLIVKYCETSRVTHSLMSWRSWQQICFKKLNNLKEKDYPNLWENRSQQLTKKYAGVLIKWWGKHQKTWNPVEVTW